jgi:hypothetical protein
MITLNLKAESPEMQALKQYLEENVNEFLADKINNGVRIEKDGKTLINKKTLETFMDYAHDEAKKLAAKNARYACIKHEIVFGWAMHYFEEADIIGKLYNEDETEYKAAKPKTVTTPKPSSPATASVITTPKKQQPQQFSLFDLVQTPTVEEKIEEPVEEIEDIDDNIDEPSELNVDMETGEILPPNHVEKKTIPLQASPLYQKYMRIQNQYPHAVIAYRLGDFFEVFGDSAVKLANNFNLTLTGRDCGLKERVAMVGFPYHSASVYFHKISELFELVVVEDDIATPYESNEIENNPPMEEENEPTMYENNDIESDDLEEMRSSAKAFEQTALCKLLEIFSDELMISEEDY